MASATAFPVIILDLLEEFMGDLPGVKSIIKRDLDPGDAEGTVGLWAGGWEPWDHEISVPEPMGRYTVQVQTLNKYANSEEGRSASSILAKSIRVMLYRDADLQVRLAQLSETSLGYRESVTRWGVADQRYVDGAYLGEHLFLTVTQLWFETRIAAV